MERNTTYPSRRRLDEMTTEVMFPSDSARLQQVTIDLAGASVAGDERRTNEDRFLIAERCQEGTVHFGESANPGHTDLLVLIVADGLGGLEAGEVASDLAVRSLARRLGSVASPEEALDPELVRNAFGEIDDALHEEGQRRESHMATTCTMASILWPRALIAHVGDSRCHLVRGTRLHRITTDHTLAAEVERQLGQPEERLTPLAHVVTRALGSRQGSPAPDLQEITLRPGDRLLLCTDGLTDVVDEEEVLSEVEGAGDASTLSRRLLAAAGARGGTDDATVVAGLFDLQGKEGELRSR